ncbi:Gas vesicle protein GvpJ [Bienertia sinuspersici]
MEIVESSLKLIGQCANQPGAHNEAIFMPENSFDHSPIVIKVFPSSKGKKPSHFYNYWSQRPYFTETVQQVWDQDIQGCAMFQAMQKLKELKAKLKGMHTEDIQATVRAVGDSNSKVFYNSLKVRTSRNTINRLMDNQGRWMEDMESITTAFTSFYCTLLQGTDYRTPLLDLNHLRFANDILMFSRGDIHTVTLNVVGLKLFSQSTRLEISAAKFELYCAGVDSVMIDRIKELSGFKVVWCPVAVPKHQFLTWLGVSGCLGTANGTSLEGKNDKARNDRMWNDRIWKVKQMVAKVQYSVKTRIPYVNRASKRTDISCFENL